MTWRQCDLCGGTGYQMVDVGIGPIPDYVEVRCRCNPAPTDEDYLAAHPWHDDRPFRPDPASYAEADDYSIPARLLA